MLRKHREQGLLQPRTKWRRYRDIIRKDPEYLCMETNIAGSRPRELFADVMIELEEAFFKVGRLPVCRRSHSPVNSPCAPCMWPRSCCARHGVPLPSAVWPPPALLPRRYPHSPRSHPPQWVEHCVTQASARRDGRPMRPALLHAPLLLS